MRWPIWFFLTKRNQNRSNKIGLSTVLEKPIKYILDFSHFDTVEKWHWNGEDFDIVVANVTIPFTSQNYYEGFVTDAKHYLTCFDYEIDPDFSGDGLEFSISE